MSVGDLIGPIDRVDIKVSFIDGETEKLTQASHHDIRKVGHLGTAYGSEGRHADSGIL